MYLGYGGSVAIDVSDDPKVEWSKHVEHLPADPSQRLAPLSNQLIDGQATKH